MGIKDSRLSSNPTHAPNQEEDETVNKVPLINVQKNKRFDRDE